MKYMSNRRWSRYFGRVGVLVLAAGILGGCSNDGSKDTIISSELVDEESGFGMDEAKLGDYMDEVILEAKRMYPVSNTITSSYNGVILKEINVKAKQKVKKGDLLVTIEPITDEFLTKKEEAIAKNKEEYDKTVQSYQNTIAALENTIAASSGTEKHLHETELAKAKRQYEWYVQDGLSVQQELLEELEKYRAYPEDLNIYAPYDGVIDALNNVSAGTELDNTRELLSMHSEESIMLSISNGGDLRYGQSVTVETGSGEKIKTYPGTVVSANNVRGDYLKDNSAIIRIEGDVDPEELGNVRVKTSSKELHNVLVVKNYAVTTDKNGSYVSVLEGDKMMKRHVVTGGTCGEYTWILQGLKAGQSVTIQ